MQRSGRNPQLPIVQGMVIMCLVCFTVLNIGLRVALADNLQDALQLVGGVLRNPAGQKLAWDFIRQHWPEIEKAGGPFASAEVVGATGVFCDADLRDQVTEFFTAHKVEAFERTYRQTVERINSCVDFKAQQQSQLASWLGQHGNAGGK